MFVCILNQIVSIRCFHYYLNRAFCSKTLGCHKMLVYHKKCRKIKQYRVFTFLFYDLYDSLITLLESSIGHGGSDGLHGYVPSLDHIVEDTVCSTFFLLEIIIFMFMSQSCWIMLIRISFLHILGKIPRKYQISES